MRRLYNERNKILKDRLPILKWAPAYKFGYLFHDFVAGFTVGLTAIPQGIAYAIVAGLPPQYGLYSGFIGCFVYLVFGSAKDVTIGEYIFYGEYLAQFRFIRAKPENIDIFKIMLFYTLDVDSIQIMI